jgi:endonuclease/exonuclease/phosphatase family metal-dependent hydrolase
MSHRGRRAATRGTGRLARGFPAGCLLTLAAVVATPVAADTPGPPRSLRYVTFNMLHGGVSSGLVGNGQHLDQRLELAAAALRALDPDVIGLQEASVGLGRGNVARRLADRLGFHHVHALATVRLFLNDFLGHLAVGTTNFAEGPAILSRYPIAAWQAWDLPRCGRLFEPRVALHAVLDTPWGRVTAFSTHTAGDPCQTRRIAELVASRRDSLPAALMGDFNATEDSGAITLLTRETGLVDAFRAANPEAPGVTVWQRIDVPYPMARRRVDYVFLVPGRAFAGAVRASRVVLDRPGQRADGRPLWPSDHYGVLVDAEVFPEGRDRAARPGPAGGG